MTRPDPVGLGTMLQSPALALEPPVDLAASVRTRAGRVRRRRRAAALASVVLAVVGVATATSTLRGGSDGLTVASPAQQLARQFPDATTPFVALTDLNGGTILTWFQGPQWCTASVRTGPPNVTCAGSLPAVVRPFAYVRGRSTESLTVDEDHVVAGLLGDGVAEVDVERADGTRSAATTVRGERFGRPVWFSRETGPDVLGYTARAADGSVLATLSLDPTHPVRPAP